jgi:hypothetical protein
MSTNWQYFPKQLPKGQLILFEFINLSHSHQNARQETQGL